MLYSKSFVFGVLDVVLGFGLLALFHANCFIAGALVKACFWNMQDSVAHDCIWRYVLQKFGQ